MGSGRRTPPVKSSSTQNGEAAGSGWSSTLACRLSKGEAKEKGEEVDGGDGVCSERDRMLFSGDVAFFRYYFTERRSFNGISRKWRSFDGMRPIFPLRFGRLRSFLFECPWSCFFYFFSSSADLRTRELLILFLLT